jgi:hypothetical protein
MEWQLMLVDAVDQYTRTESRSLKETDDEVVVSDRTLTIQFITNVFFWSACLSPPPGHSGKKPLQSAAWHRSQWQEWEEADRRRMTNIAALSSLASTWIEREVDFWASYLMASLCLLLTQILIFAGRNKFSQSRTHHILRSPLLLTARSDHPGPGQHRAPRHKGHVVRRQERLEPAQGLARLPAPASR